MFDTTCLTHFARAGRLATLQAITADDRRLVPPEVMREAHAGVAEYPAIGNLIGQQWIEIVELDIFETVRAAAFKGELGGPPTRHLGECEVLAIAEARAGVAVLDDRDARAVAGNNSVKTAGTLSIIAAAVAARTLDETSAAQIVEELRSTDMRLPEMAAGFPEWARRNGLL